MMSYLWILKIGLVGSDRTVNGTMRTYKTFPPFPGLVLTRCGIYNRTEEDDRRGGRIDIVLWDDATDRDSPGYFTVILSSDHRHPAEPVASRQQLYSNQWEWE